MRGLPSDLVQCVGTRRAAYSDHDAEDVVSRSPAIHATVIVGDLYLIALDRVYLMQVHPSVDLGVHDIADLNLRGIHWCERDRLAMLDKRSHGIP